MTANPETPLCGQCWEPTRDVVACERCGQVVDLRGGVGTYRLEARLGEGASGVTFRARRLEDGQAVCVKALSFRGLTSFEAERLFQRETAILKQLRHPQIPNYIDSFSSGHGRTLALVLVQDLVDGVDLADEIAARRPSVDRVLDTLDELLSILEYLHRLAPPVIHRDIKPKNIMRRRDGRLVLIDFGAVKDAIHASFDPGMSLVGTVGYMAPEQLRGEASPASDLYAVGMVAVFLLSGREPATLLDADHTVRWEQAVSVDPPVLEWLRRMTHPRADERPASAKEARRLLAESRREATVDEPRRVVARRALEVARPAASASSPSQGEAARRESTSTPAIRLGVFGATMLGIFGVMTAFGVGSLLPFYLVAEALIVFAWLPLAKAGQRGAKEATIAMFANASSGVLSLVSWKLGGLVAGVALVAYFGASAVYLRGLSRTKSAPRWLRFSALLQSLALVAAVYLLVIVFAFDAYDPMVLAIAQLAVSAGHLATIPIFAQGLTRE